MLRVFPFFIAAVGLILAAASPPPKDNLQEPAQNTPTKVERSLDDMAGSLRDANRASDLERPCEEGDDKRSSDLCAQWKAADAARGSANASWLFGALGTLIGVLTLGAACAAAFFAKKAADYTETGAKAAQDAVNETQRIGEAQVRCYLTAERARIVQLGNGKIVAYCTVSNSGNSPACEVRLEGDMTVFDRATNDGALLKQIDSEKGYFVYQVPSGSDVELGPLQLELTEAQMTHFLSIPNTLLTLRVKISFEDVFGVKITTNARFDYIPKNGFLTLKSFEMERGSDTRLYKAT